MRARDASHRGSGNAGRPDSTGIDGETSRNQVKFEFSFETEMFMLEKSVLG
jgi:hypothetical protein